VTKIKIAAAKVNFPEDFSKFLLTIPLKCYVKIRLLIAESKSVFLLQAGRLIALC
tara:strand:- start:131 stop:295 length:165 start_codon:yes stop_codon:yes gene_type:complete